MKTSLPNNEYLKNYKIKDTFGVGGTSIVYLALKDKTKYFIKEFFPSCYDNEITRNKNGILTSNDLFQFEYNNMKSEFVKQIDRHKNLKNSGNGHVLSLKEYFEENNTYYIVYEYVDGTPLNQLLEENNSPYNDIRKILKMIRRLIETLEPLHNENYLHLDISPDNIFIDNTLRDDKPEVKIIDYGNVIHINELDEYVANLLYKEHYSAPELIDSIFHEKNESIGFHSDIYSITSVLFQMLLGRPLFFLDEIALTISDFNENQYFIRLFSLS